MLETHIDGSSIKILRYTIAVSAADRLGLYFDGELSWWIEGPPPPGCRCWAEFYIEIPGGSHTLGWGFTNLGGNGYGLLDLVQLRDLSYNNPPDTPAKPLCHRTWGWKGVEFHECSVEIPSDPDGDWLYLITDWGDGTTSTMYCENYHYGNTQSISVSYTHLTLPTN